MNTGLSDRFEQRLYEYYLRAKFKAKYNAVRFLHMLDANGGLVSARMLIN